MNNNKKLKQSLDFGMVNKAFSSTLMVMVISAMIAMIGSVIDGLVIGNCMGVDSMAAYGLAAPILIVVAVVAGILQTCMQNTCSAELGKGNIEEARRIFSSILLLGMILGLICLAIICLFSGSIAKLLGATGSNAYLLPPSCQYLIGLGLGAPAIIGMDILSPLMQLDNDRERVIKATVIMTVVNVSGDLFIAFALKNWEYRMFGMALFTTISYAAAFAYLLLHFLRKDCIFRLFYKTANIKTVLPILLLGLPTAVGRLCGTLRTFTLNKLLLVVAAGGAVAAFSIQTNMVNLFGSVGMGIGFASMLLVGMFYGEKDGDSIADVVRCGILKTVFIVLPIAVVMFAFAPVFVNLYGANSDADVKLAAVHAVRCYAVSLPLFTVSIVIMNHLQGIRKLKLANIYCFFDNYGFVCLTAFILGHTSLGIDGVWMAFPIGEVLSLVLYFVIVLCQNKKLPTSIKEWLLLPQTMEEQAESSRTYTIFQMDEICPVSEDIVSFCKSKSISNRTGFLLGLYVEEMCKNIIEYAFPEGKNHHLDVRLVLNESDAVLRIRNDCKPFDPREYAGMLHSEEDQTAHIGIRLLTKSADSIDYMNALKMNNLIIRVNL